jgi:hypothetical protein
MKRTYGNTKPPQQGLRRVRIIVRGQCVGFLWARSLRKALEEFYSDHLSPHGFSAPIYVGNELSVVKPGEPTSLNVTALEVCS